MQDLKAKIFTEEGKGIWNKFVSDSPWGDILQIWEWGELKKIEKWRPLRVAIMKNGSIALAAQILMKKIPFLGNYAYIPYGPVFHDIKDLEELLPVLNDFLVKNSKNYNFASLEIEPRIGRINPDDIIKLTTNDPINNLINTKIIETYEANGYKVSGRNMQPQSKLYYNLEKEEVALLAQCKKNTRYNVKLAEKKNITFKEYSPDDPLIEDKLIEFYNLMIETQARTGGYPIRSFDFFEKFLQLFKGTANVVLSEVSFDGTVIAMNISARTGYWASSFYAASNRFLPHYKAAYLMRWKSVMSAKAFGSKIYDFWGVVNGSSDHEGYTKNKLSYGGLRVENYGLLVFPINPIKYAIWDFALWARKTVAITFRKIAFKSSNFFKELTSGSDEVEIQSHPTPTIPSVTSQAMVSTAQHVDIDKQIVTKQSIKTLARVEKKVLQNKNNSPKNQIKKN